MTLYREWHDLLHYRDSEKITTEAQRLDISQAIRFETNSAREYLQYAEGEIEHRGVVVPETNFVASDDEFEAMEINAIGHVTIWTRDYVFGIIRDGNAERFRGFPRHPPGESSAT